MNGIACTDNDAYGSLPGSLGTIGTTLAEASLPGADPGYLCATPSTYITKTSSAGTGYVGPGRDDHLHDKRDEHDLHGMDRRGRVRTPCRPTPPL